MPRLFRHQAQQKNNDKKRDPEMHSTRKNNQYHFGMKIHIGTDVNSNCIHSATVTSANEADINELPNLLRENDKVIFAVNQLSNGASLS